MNSLLWVLLSISVPTVNIIAIIDIVTSVLLSVLGNVIWWLQSLGEIGHFKTNLGPVVWIDGSKDIRVKCLESNARAALPAIRGTDFISLKLNVLLTMLTSPTMHRLISPGTRRCPSTIVSFWYSIPYSLYSLYYSLYSFSGRTQSDQESDFETCFLWKVQSSLECRRTCSKIIRELSKFY